MKRRKWDEAGPAAASAPVTTPGHPAAAAPAAALDRAAAARAVFAEMQGPAGQLPPGTVLGEDAQRRMQAGAAAVADRLNAGAAAAAAAAQAQAIALAAVQKHAQAWPAEAPGGAGHIKCEVTFNDTNPRTRHVLTKRATQQELETKWRVVCVVRGRYYAPGELPAGDTDELRPLFMRITPGRTLPADPQWRQHACDMAAADVTAIIANRPRPMPKPMPAGGLPPAGGATPPLAAAVPAQPPAAAPWAAGGGPPAGFPRSGPSFLCLYPCCEGPGAAEFDAAARLRGPSGAYLAHIAASTGCTARMEGRGSGAAYPEPSQPLHLRLDCADPAKLEEGRKLAANLIDTIRAEFRAACPSAPAPPPSGQYDPPLPQVGRQQAPAAGPPPAHPLIPPAGYGAAAAAAAYPPPMQRAQQQAVVQQPAPAAAPGYGAAHAPHMLQQQQGGPPGAYPAAPEQAYAQQAYAQRQQQPQQQQGYAPAQQQQQQQQQYAQHAQHPLQQAPQQAYPIQQQVPQQGSAPIQQQAYPTTPQYAGPPQQQLPLQQQQHAYPPGQPCQAHAGPPQLQHQAHHAPPAQQPGYPAAPGGYSGAAYGSSPAAPQPQRSPYAGYGGVYGGGPAAAPQQQQQQPAGAYSSVYSHARPAGGYGAAQAVQPGAHPPDALQQHTAPQRPPEAAEPPAKRRFTEQSKSGHPQAHQNPYAAVYQLSRSAVHSSEDNAAGPPRSHAEQRPAGAMGPPPPRATMGPPPPRLARQPDVVLPGMEAYDGE